MAPVESNRLVAGSDRDKLKFHLNRHGIDMEWFAGLCAEYFFDVEEESGRKIDRFMKLMKVMGSSAESAKDDSMHKLIEAFMAKAANRMAGSRE